jgi:hypothetical protein
LSARRDLDLGRLMIAVGLLGFGALALIYDDFGLDRQRLGQARDRSLDIATNGMNLPGSAS